MADYIDVTGLSRFKTKQDAYNLTKFTSLSGGKVTAEQLPSYVDDVIEGYAKETGGVIGFYEDSNCTVTIAGEVGKIYVDCDLFNVEKTLRLKKKANWLSEGWKEGVTP